MNKLGQTVNASLHQLSRYLRALISAVPSVPALAWLDLWIGWLAI